MKMAVVGAGWAGLAAAVQALQAGHQVTLFEASGHAGGRARTLPPGGDGAAKLDNGQHILIGAYTETLRLMRLVSIQPEAVLHELPLALRFADGNGLAFPDWPSPLDALAGMLGARGWSWSDRASLLRHVLRWQWLGFACDPDWTVQRLCQQLSPKVWADLIEPLCVAALNTPAVQADARVFLRVLHDALLGGRGCSHLLLPRTDLNALFPDAALHWLQQHGAQVWLSQRVRRLQQVADHWQIDGQSYAAVILAGDASNMAQVLLESAQTATSEIANQMQHWARLTAALRFETIATVYGKSAGTPLPAPLLALHSSAQYPAQFVFDRGQLGGPPGLLAFVASAARGERASIQAQVLQQARDQLQLTLQPLQTVVEKRATFACTPGLQRPPTQVCAGLLACGDYIAGPYPATLEGAVRSARAASAALPI